MPVAADGRRRVLPQQHAAFGRAEPFRPGEVLARVHIPRRKQPAGARHALGIEAGSAVLGRPAAGEAAAITRCDASRANETTGGLAARFVWRGSRA
ncbi:hypothetical protein BCEN4_160018 [Burkholderia cenocepacia]|nr:hypothetical protein BCEN4_160018 [Burkholderia cenocepacia]